MRYRAVIFDLFGTLVHSFNIQQHAQHLQKVAGTLGVPTPGLRELWDKSRRNRETGRFPSVADNLRFICRELQIDADEQRVEAAARAYLEFARAAFRIRDDATATLEALKKRGHRTGLISDCGPHVPALWAATPLARLVDTPVFSSLERVKKPDARIYQLACKRLDVQPSECLYVGDGGSHELTGASAVGMTAVQVAAVPKDDSLIIDGETWAGKRIETLREVLELV
ncbi:MAG: HAD family hydrolase [Chloroflexi bacterium]|nr:HAD family hydrolase [Chloroflexota bacterium]